MQSGRKEAALALLGDRAVHYWDLPPLLMHLGGVAADDGQLELAKHLWQRVFDLSKRGLPKMNMTAFEYVSQSSLVDLLCREGDVEGALLIHRSIKPNPGNAMAHALQYARLLVTAGELKDAMSITASILVTAEKRRTGYSRNMGLGFIKSSPDMAALRNRADWKAMVKDPAAYLRQSRCIAST